MLNQTTIRTRIRYSAWMAAALVALAASFLWFGSARAQASQPPSQQPDDYCLSCHSKPGLTMTLASGEAISITVTAETLANSKHSAIGIQCQNCHTEIKSYPHPAITFNNRRDLSRSYYQACQRCHPTNYTKTMDSMHAKAASAGNPNAPICTDCHGFHDVQAPDKPRANISNICGKCHTDIYAQYKTSVHGAALIQENNTDVPVCTDCHGVHNIQDPRTQQFRVNTPELCAGCHSNQQLMAKYGINANVYNIYKTSWHGVDVSVYQAKWPDNWHNSAVCTDCHGVHDIRKTSDPASHVNPTNRLATCQKCHPGAGPNWVDAWTGHNDISLQRTPEVFYTQAFYGDFAYLVLWASAIYVLLQILRATVGRIRRNLP